MAKPILIVRVGYFFTDEECDTMLDKLTKKLTDYHVILIKKGGADVEFEVYNGVGEDNLDFEELKKDIKNAKL